MFDQCRGSRAPLTTAEKRQLVREVLDEIFGLGPVEELMRDPAISDILVNGPKQIYIGAARRDYVPRNARG